MVKTTEFMTRQAKGAAPKGRRGAARPGSSGLAEALRDRALLEWVAKVMDAAERSGLTGDKTARIGGRVSPELVRQAKAHTGIEADSDLINFALANVALEDNFLEAFRKVRGTVDRDIKLGF